MRTSGFPITSWRSWNQTGFQKHLKRHSEFFLKFRLLGETSPNSGACQLFLGSCLGSHIIEGVSSSPTAPLSHRPQFTLQQKGSGQPRVVPRAFRPGGGSDTRPGWLLCKEPAVLGAAVSGHDRPRGPASAILGLLKCATMPADSSVLLGDQELNAGSAMIPS